MGSRGSEAAFAFHVGWPADLPPAERQAQLNGRGTALQRRLRAAAAPPAWPGSNQWQQGQGAEAQSVQVVLLSAADAHWPLAKVAAEAAGAAAAADGAAGAAAGAAPLAEGQGHAAPAAAANGFHSVPGGTEGAAAQSGAAGGDAGAPGAFGSLLDLGGSDSRRSSQDGGPSRSPGLGSSGPGGSNGCGCGEAGRLEAAIRAPARLKARVQAAAGALAGAEPELVLVRGS